MTIPQNKYKLPTAKTPNATMLTMLKKIAKSRQNERQPIKLTNDITNELKETIKRVQTIIAGSQLTDVYGIPDGWSFMAAIHHARTKYIQDLERITSSIQNFNKL